MIYKTLTVCAGLCFIGQVALAQNVQIPTQAQSQNALKRYHITKPGGDASLSVAGQAVINHQELFADTSKLPDTVIQVKEFIVEGVSAYAPETIAAITTRFEKRDLSLKQIFEVADIITNLY